MIRPVNIYARGNNTAKTATGRVARFNRATYDGVRSRLEGLPGGATNMNVFSARNHAAGTYTRNVNLWCADLVPQLTACVVAKAGGFDGWTDQFGGIAITKRHVLYTGHAHPYAAGTWGPWLGAGPTTIRFLKTNGDIVERTQIHQAVTSNSDAYNPSRCIGLLGALDACVGVLDADLPEGIHVMPLAPTIPDDMRYLSDPSSTAVPVSFAFSQGWWSTTSYTTPDPISDYPLHHSQMMYVNGPSVAPFNLFDYAIWPGDSGTPSLKVADDLVCVNAVVSGTDAQVVGMAAFYNCMIAAANANAVALGRMSPGEADYQVTVRDL